ncbi:MAG: YciI family protein [Chloroflexota bacterium]
MASELPENVAIERVYLLEATYAPDADELRRPVRARHLARLAELRDEGVVLEAGALLDMTASILLVRALDEEAALEIARRDVYMAAGVWVELRARPFGRVCRPAELPGR